MMPEPPKVRLVSSKACAVDPRLLACSNADNLQDTNMNASSSLTPVSKELFCTCPLIYLLIFWKKMPGQGKRNVVIFESLKVEDERFMTIIYTFLLLNIMKVSRTRGHQ